MMLRFLILLFFFIAFAFPAVAQDDLLCDPEVYDAAYYYGQGWDHYREGQYISGVPYFTCALEINPDYDDAQHMRGLSYELNGDYENALADYTVVVERSPDYLISYIGIGNTYLAMQDYEAARDAFTDYIAHDPENANVLYNRAIVYYLLEDYEAALADYSRSIELNPQFADAYGGRSRTYAVLGDFQPAVEDAKIAIVLEPLSKGWLYAALAEAYTGLERYDEARSAYDTYLQMVDEADYDVRVLADIARLDTHLAQIRGDCLVTPFVLNANRRIRPSLEMRVIGVIEINTQARVVAQRTDDEGFIWWRLADDAGWVRADAVFEMGACDRVEDVEGR